MPSDWTIDLHHSSRCISNVLGNSISYCLNKYYCWPFSWICLPRKQFPIDIFAQGRNGSQWRCRWHRPISCSWIWAANAFRVVSTVRQALRIGLPFCSSCSWKLTHCKGSLWAFRKHCTSSSISKRFSYNSNCVLSITRTDKYSLLTDWDFMVFTNS